VEDWTDRRQDNGDQQDNNQEREGEPYEVERIATVLAVTCMFLAALYTIFAILLFLYYGSEDPKGLDLDDDIDERAVSGGIVSVGHVPTHHHVHGPHHHMTNHHLNKSATAHLPSISHPGGDPRRENFITMGD